MGAACAGFYLVSVVLLVVGVAMDVTNGSVYNTGLLADRAAIVQAGVAFAICGSIFAVGHNLSSRMLTAGVTAGTGVAPGAGGGTADGAVPVAATLEQRRETITTSLEPADHELAGQPEVVRSLSFKTEEKALVAAVMISRGFRLLRYERDAILVKRGLLSQRLWSMNDAVSTVGDQPRSARP